MTLQTEKPWYAAVRRKVEVRAYGKWVSALMGQLKNGDRIRMFEPSGAEVSNPDGSTEWTVIGDPIENEFGHWSVRTRN